MRVEFNILIPCTKAEMHCLTNSSVDCMGEGKPTLLNSLNAGSNRLPLPREKYSTLTNVLTSPKRLFDLAHSNNNLSLCFESIIPRVTAIPTST